MGGGEGGERVRERKVSKMNSRLLVWEPGMVMPFTEIERCLE